MRAKHPEIWLVMCHTNLSPVRGKNESPRMIAAIPERRAVTEEISGVIERVTFHNEDSGFCILRVKARLGAFSGLIRISRRL